MERDSPDPAAAGLPPGAAHHPPAQPQDGSQPQRRGHRRYRVYYYYASSIFLEKLWCFLNSESRVGDILTLVVLRCAPTHGCYQAWAPPCSCLRWGYSSRRSGGDTSQSPIITWRTRAPRLVSADLQPLARDL